MTAEKTRTLPLPQIVGGISLVGGIVLLAVAKKKGGWEAKRLKQGGCYEGQKISSMHS